MAQLNMSPQAYSEFVAERFSEAAADPKLIVFTNRGPSHAKTVLREMVTRAQSSIEIVTGNLSAAVYDGHELRIAARELIGGIHILVADDDPFLEDSALLHLKKEVESDLVHVRMLSPFLRRINFKGHVKHFALSDKKYLRVEDDTENHTATIVLNAEKKMVDSYAGMFQLLWQGSEPYRFERA